MNKKSAIVSVVILVIILVLSYCYFGKNSQNSTFPANMPPSDSSDNKAHSEQVAPPPNEDVANSANTDAAGFLPTKMEDPERFDLIQKNIKDLGQCLHIQVGTFDKSEEFNFETLNELVAPDLGQVVHQEEEWSSTDIKTNSGEIRRIFIKSSGADTGSINRQLKYYAMNPLGGQKELPISKEQEFNPSETLIASLESDGQLVTKSLARKFFYQNGDDLNVVEKNGQIYSFGLGHEGAFFSCQGVDSAKTIRCVCK
ncbi:MAG: hypothetical protein ACM3MG_06590 [Bacillota bacterium]